MTVLTLYVLFALTTAIVAVYELILPLRSMLDEDKIIEQWYIVVVTFFMIAVLVAPAILLPCLIPSMGDRFREAILKELQVDKA